MSSSRLLAVLTILATVSSAQAADLSLFLHQASRAGPSKFVDFVDRYYAERKSGKSGFQERESQVGKAIFGMMFGGVAGALSEDMVSGAKQGYASGSFFGENFGNAYGFIEGQNQEMEDLIVDLVNEKQPILHRIEIMMAKCIKNRIVVSECKKDKSIQQALSKVAMINMKYCNMALELRSPIDKSQFMIDRDLCHTN